MNRRVAWSATALGMPLVLGVALTTGPAVATAPAQDAATASPATDQAVAGKKKPKKYCMGKRATIVGSKKANRIVGTRKADVIWAGAGADTVMSLGGKDRVCGGPGADALIGGPGRDRLNGGKQRDLCWGEQREHKQHFACDVHLKINGLPAKPPSPHHGPAASQAQPVAAQQAPAQTPGQAGAGTYFTYNQPVCAIDYPWSYVYLGNVFFQTYYTQPGWIAIRPMYYRFSYTGMTQGPFWRDNGYHATDGWAMFSAPADGQPYYARMLNLQVSRDDRLFMVYEVYWWNGSQWTDHRVEVAP